MKMQVVLLSVLLIIVVATQPYLSDALPVSKNSLGSSTFKKGGRSSVGGSNTSRANTRANTRVNTRANTRANTRVNTRANTRANNDVGAVSPTSSIVGLNASELRDTNPGRHRVSAPSSHSNTPTAREQTGRTTDHSMPAHHPGTVGSEGSAGGGNRMSISHLSEMRNTIGASLASGLLAGAASGIIASGITVGTQHFMNASLGFGTAVPPVEHSKPHEGSSSSADTSNAEKGSDSGTDHTATAEKDSDI